ncbi:MAG: zinc ribbon domain-containing protein [Syntrophales bacterium]|nr:zinc ribbon domain-containing protein [Syntrophales bacterium]
MICPKCHGTIPEISRYCLHCGVLLSPPEQHEEDEEDMGMEWEDRVLCSDGACTGTIVDGKCTFCGKPLSDPSESLTSS